LALAVVVVAQPHPCGVALQLGHAKVPWLTQPQTVTSNSVPAEQDMCTGDWSGWHWQKVEQLIRSCQY